MKKTFLKLVTLVTICTASTVFAQVGVGVPAGDIHPSAELEVKSSTKGFLPPRMTKAQRLAMIAQGSTTFPAAGLLVFQTDGDANEPTGLYFFDGTAWRNGAGVVGAKGDRGETGLTGAAGAIGPKGDRGETGLTGTAGAIGPKGDTGANGLPGAAGTKGDKGDQGIQGPQGLPGVNGPIGLTGTAGAIGPKGDTGANGLPGAAGTKGDKGDQGEPGLQGQAGAQGPKGDTGLKGDKGEIGAQGPQGLSGANGLPGTAGSKGDKGDQGEPGLQGQAGAQGPKGETGATGAQGLPGSSKDEQKLSVSASGDTLYLQNGGFVIIPGLSVANSITKPTSGYGSNITDSENNTYKTVYIGTQQWMAENLKVSKYSDGTTIPNITYITQQNNTTGAWAYYNNNAANNAKWGKLYNWYAVSRTTNGNKNVCPTGWHVPTDAEWTVLTDYLGGESVAGGKLKEVGTTNWNSPNTGATNTSLFSALPDGYRSSGGDYDGIGSFGNWWSSTEYGTTNAWLRNLYNLNGNAYRFNNDKKNGFSVRCLRD